MTITESLWSHWILPSWENSYCLIIPIFLRRTWGNTSQHCHQIFLKVRKFYLFFPGLLQHKVTTHSTLSVAKIQLVTFEEKQKWKQVTHRLYHRASYLCVTFKGECAKQVSTNSLSDCWAICNWKLSFCLLWVLYKLFLYWTIEI